MIDPLAKTPESANHSQKNNDPLAKTPEFADQSQKNNNPLAKTAEFANGLFYSERLLQNFNNFFHAGATRALYQDSRAGKLIGRKP